MRVHSNEHISFSINRAQKNATQIEKTLHRLGTGIKTAKGDENASNLPISEKMRAQIRGISQAQRNMQDGLSALETANEGLNNINGLLQRARELAVLSATDTLTDTDRLASNEELQQILAAIDETANNMEFNTRKILGEDTSLTLHVGANPTQQITIDLININTQALGIDNLSLVTREGAEAMIDTIDQAFRTTSGHLTKIGSKMDAIEHHLANAMVFEGNITRSLSMLEDTEVAEEMMNFIQQDIRQQGDQLLVKQVNSNLHSLLGLFTR